MAKCFLGNTGHKLYIGSAKVKKGYIGNTPVYSTGNIVTYIVDSGISYQEETDCDSSCLTPASFIPDKPGWTFAGWREDTSAAEAVLTEKLMHDDPVTLYAVFKQAVTVSYDANGGSGSTAAQTKYRYYNNGNIINPTFSLSENDFIRPDWRFKGWSASPSAASILLIGSEVTLSQDMTYYAVWKTSEPFNLFTIYWGDENEDGETFKIWITNIGWEVYDCVYCTERSYKPGQRISNGNISPEEVEEDMGARFSFRSDPIDTRNGDIFTPLGVNYYMDGGSALYDADTNEKLGDILSDVSINITGHRHIKIMGTCWNFPYQQLTAQYYDGLVIS